MTDAKHRDIRVAKSEESLDFHLLLGSIISVDRAHLDFEWFYSLEKRGVCYTDPEPGKGYEFFTNNMKMAASTIAAIYKSRWEIELFFKSIKQNLNIKSSHFSEPAAMQCCLKSGLPCCYYLLLAYIKFQTKYRGSLQVLTRVIASVVREQRLLIDMLSLNKRSIKKAKDPIAQLALF